MQTQLEGDPFRRNHFQQANMSVLIWALALEETPSGSLIPLYDSDGGLTGIRRANTMGTSITGGAGRGCREEWFGIKQRA